MKTVPKLTLEQLQLENSYLGLPEIAFSRHTPRPLKHQHLVHFNNTAAELIKLDPAQAQRSDFLDLLTGAKALPGIDPVALCYAGHQFGHLVPRLGDGRAILLSQVRNHDGSLWDLQLKGAGLTLYSRDGDGRAVLRSTIREYLCSHAMHALGVPTTHALFISGSDEEVYRENIETGAMLLRMAPSHIRFGSFEYYFYSQRYDDLKTLGEYVVQTHFPELLQAENPYQALLAHAVRSTASLIAQWQAVGFSHGVMNSDNMSIHGITLDYGPFGFMEQYDPGFICNHSDHHGRYAFEKQPEVGLFNLSCLAQAMLPLLDENTDAAVEIAKHELQQYQPQFMTFYAANMRAKLGLLDAMEHDQQLVQKLLDIMQANRVDFTLCFRALSIEDTHTRDTAVRDLFVDREAADNWLEDYQQRLADEDSIDAERSVYMKQENPKYILRNYMAEVAIRKASEDRDYSEIERLMRCLSNPYDEQPEFEDYAGHPPDWAESLSVSCSS
ncbi:MAG: YdiU family protein [Gammaproteobacteria bacterium]